MNKDGMKTVVCSNLLNWVPKKNGLSKSLFLTYNELSPKRNVSLGLPHFIDSVNCHIPGRIKDLLEIAGYVYAADRLIKRGKTESVEYQSWARTLDFHISVRDYNFWSQNEIKKLLNEALTFISGDNLYHFTFYKGGNDTGQMSLFDREEFSLDKKDNSVIALFSGGLDSLAGVLDLLETTTCNLLLISHRSSNPGITTLQKSLTARLQKDYPNRIQYFPFYCSLSGERASEETQRSRIFLYTAIAFSLSELAAKKEIFVFENGVTSINFYKRQDLINARASRTTHPKTIFYLQKIFSKISGFEYRINHPFVLKTKTDILNLIAKYRKQHYIESTITCTKTFLKFQNNTQASHCGGCSQCIDRRFATFASDLEEYDAIYDIDISKDQILDPEARTHLFDYINLVSEFNTTTKFSFPYDFTDILTDLIPYLNGQNNIEKIESVYQLIKNHSLNISYAIKKILILDNPLEPKKDNTLISYIGDRTYLKPSPERLVENIKSVLARAIPEAFKRSKPQNENVLNDTVNALLIPHEDEYEREYPGIRFSITKVIPDHSLIYSDIIIESKLFKPNKSISAVTDEIAADIIKYPKEKCKLFIVYDPVRKITNDEKFSRDFEKNPHTFICVIR